MSTETLRALAWSEGDDGDDDEFPQCRSWRTTVLLCVGIAIVTGVAWTWAAITLFHTESATAPTHVVVATPPTPPAPAPATAAAPTITTTVVVPVSPPDQVATQPHSMTVDERFLARIRSDGMEPNGDGHDLIDQAHAVCSYHTRGFSVSQIIAGTNTDDPQVSSSQKSFFVNLAITTYCP